MTACPKSSSAIQMGKLHPQAMVKACEVEEGASWNYQKSPTCWERNGHSTCKQMPLAFFSLIQSAQMLNTFFPAMLEMHIAWQSSSAWLPNVQLKFIDFFLTCRSGQLSANKTELVLPPAGYLSICVALRSCPAHLSQQPISMFKLHRSEC